MAAETIEGTLAELVREMYPTDEILNTLLKGSALFSEMPKDWDAHGDPIRVAVKYASTSGSGNDFGEAQSAHDGARRAAFLLTTADEYSLYRIAGKAARLNKANEGALIDLIEEVGVDAMETLERNMHRGMWRNGGGAIGQIAGGSASTTLQLANINDIVHFQVGDKIESWGTDGLGVTAGDSEYIEIAEIDEDLGTITKTGGNWSANGHFALNDYLFKRGTIGKTVTGLAGWIPSTAPSSTLFFQVDRSVAANALGGVRVTYDAGDGALRPFLVRMAGRLARGKARPTHAFLNPLRFAQLADELDNQAKFEKIIPKGSSGMPMQGVVGFEAIMLTVGSGVIKVISDADCPTDLVYMLDMETWKIYGYGAPGVLDQDGMTIRAVSNADAYEGRFGCYWQIGCRAPGRNGVGILTDLALPGT